MRPIGKMLLCLALVFYVATPAYAAKKGLKETMVVMPLIARGVDPVVAEKFENSVIESFFAAYMVYYGEKVRHEGAARRG